MRIKTFIAADMREAMAAIRAELGEEAVIVSSQKAKGSGVLVRVAVEGSLAEERIEDGVARALESQSEPDREPAFAAAALPFHEGLMARLRAASPPSPRPQRNFNRAELLGLLRGHRLADGLAHVLAEAAEHTRLSDMTLALAAALDRRMTTAPLELARSQALLLVGPPGTGKTLLAARIAGVAQQTGRAVRLIAGDPKGAGAVERLRTFATHLNVTFLVAENLEALQHEMALGAGAGELVIIDTAGFDPRDGATRAAFAELGRRDGLEPLGVVSAAADAEETDEICSALAELGARRLIVSFLDGTRRLGALAAAATSGCGLAHVSRSPFLAGALETLTPLSLARALLEASNPSLPPGERP